MSSTTATESEVIGFTDEELDEARRYTIVVAWSPRDEVYLVRVPELPGLTTHGQSQIEAIEMGVEAIATCLAGLREFGRPVPPPRFASVPV